MAFERQRDLHFQHVANLADMLEHDEWVGMSVLLFASEGRDTWLIDIQHRRRPHVEFGRWVEAEVPGTRSFGSFPTIRLRPRRCSCRARTRGSRPPSTSRAAIRVGRPSTVHSNGRSHTRLGGRVKSGH